MWPANLFAEIADHILMKYKIKIFICGSRKEYELAKIIERNYQMNEIINLAGKTSLSEFVEVVRNSILLVGNETSAIHIAYAVNTKSICLLGGGQYGRFMPYSEKYNENAPIPIYDEKECFKCNWECHLEHNIEDAYPCISGLDKSNVVNRIDYLLSNQLKGC